MASFPVQLSSQFWILNALIALLGVAATVGVLGIGVVLGRPALRSNGLIPNLAPIILLSMMFLSFGGGLAYALNEARQIASFRVGPNEISWTNWTRRRAYSWREIKRLTLKRNLKGNQVLEIRCVKSAFETEAFEINASDIQNFAALVNLLERSTHLAVQRLQ